MTPSTVNGRDRAKLPKWAQQELRRLEADLRDAHARLGAGPDDSDTFADPYADAPRPLGKGTTVEFRTGPNRFGDRVLVSVGKDRVRIHGGDSLHIYPSASNVIEVKPGRFT